jgi:uncharacterized membrane protein YfcA
VPVELLYIGCGVLAGVVAGYVGIGGGIIMVPFLTVVMGVDIKVAVPVSVAMIVVTSLASSNEYLKRDKVDMELVVMLGLFMALGNIAGSLLSEVIPSEWVRVALAVILVYAAASMVKGRKEEEVPVVAHHSWLYYLLCGLIAFLGGTVAAIVGIGGGIMLVPIIYLLLGAPFTTAKGTSLLLVGFSSAASTAVYMTNNRIDYAIAAPVIFGIIFGGRLGGRLGSVARPLIARLVFGALMLYLGFRLAYEPLSRLF